MIFMTIWILMKDCSSPPPHDLKRWARRGEKQPGVWQSVQGGCGAGLVLIAIIIYSRKNHKRAILGERLEEGRRTDLWAGSLSFDGSIIRTFSRVQCFYKGN